MNKENSILLKQYKKFNLKGKNFFFKIKMKLKKINNSND